MRTVAVVLALCPAFCPLLPASEPSALEIIRRTAERGDRNLLLLQSYTWTETADLRRLDKKGATKKREVKTSDVLWIDGTQYHRLVARDGKPLSEEQARKEQEKIDREIEKRRRESEKDRRKRLEKQEKELREEREFRLQIPDAFTWTLLGEEDVLGRPCWKIRAEPKPGFKGKGRAAGFLPKLRGVVWIDKSHYEWARVEAETLDTLSFGLVLARVAKGAEISVVQTLVNQELWAPHRLRVALNAKALLLIGANMELNMSFSDYKKYSVDSHVVAVSETQ